MSAGVLVHPGLAERVLRQHPAVAEACVLGGADGAVAYVVLEPWAAAGVEAELQSLCREQLPVYARPAAIERIVSLPKNPAGCCVTESVRVSRRFYCVDDFACPLNTVSIAACAHFSPSPLDTPIAPMT